MNKFKEFYSGLEEREKRILIGGLSFLLIFVVINFFILPVINYKKDLKNKINSCVYQTNQIKLLGKEYKSLVKTSSFGQVSQGSDLALFSFMDSIAGKAGIKNNVDYMKPSTEKTGGLTIEKVEIKVSGIDMKSLIGFIHLVESSSDAVVIKGLRISRSDKGGAIISTLQAEIVKSNA
ncbi:MAG: type II secretion system protein GspM [Desulforegulaceae bacterium]|nr:type II secretion system protein GspM [Desulforegulaceae bacterium]